MRSAWLAFAIAVPLAAASFRVYQTNSAGDSVSVIDPIPNQIVMEVKGIEAPHGVAFSPDGKRAYITCEADDTLWATDTKSGKQVGKTALSGHPNNLAVSKDGARVFVGIRSAPGAVDVVDAASLKIIKSVAVKG